MSDTYDSILALRAIREFADRPISDDDMDKVLQAARWTGSSKNTQRWSFIVVNDPDQKNRLCGAGDFMTPVQNAAAAICLVQERDCYEFDTGRLAQNIMLAADALGLATCPVTLHHNEIASEVLALPEGVRCRYAIAIGYPTSSASPANRGGRKPIEDLVHRNSYGT